MKARWIKLMIFALVMAMLLCGCSESIQTSTTESKDGIVAVLTTDKNTYSGLDTAQVALQIINNTGKKVAVSTDMKAPEGLNLNLDTTAGSFQMEPGQSVSLSEIAVEMDPTGIIVCVAVGVLVAAAAVVVVILIIRKRKTKRVISMLLALVLLAGVVLPVMPVTAVESEADYASSLTIQHPVTVDGKEVIIEATVNYEIGIPEEETDSIEPTEEEPWVDPDCNKPDGKVTAFFYNDYDGDKAMVDKGATLKYNDQKMDIATSGDNGYFRAEIASEQVNGFYQGDFRNNKIVDHLVVHLDVSTENQIPAGSYLGYRYNENNSASVFSFDVDGRLVVGGTAYDNAKVEPGKWLSLDLVFDLTPEANDLCDIYVNGEKIAQRKLAKHEELYKISYMRLNFAAKENLGKTALIDNFIIYESAEILDISEVNSPRYPYYQKAREGEDVEMVNPDLADLPSDLIAVAVGTDKAYVNGEVVTMSAAAKNGSSGNVFTDAFVPGDFLTKYLGVSGVSADGMHSVLRYATGKNVVVDDRGFILLTKDPLDAVVYQKELTLLYGYLVTGELVYNYAAAPAWTQSVIDEAVASKRIYWGISSRRSMPAIQSMSALYYMVLISYMNPDATASNGTVVADEAAARIKEMISGGKEVPAEVGTNWEHNIAASAVALAKYTPAIWDQMTEDDIKRLDLMMECMGIAANWGFNKDNNYKTGFDFYGNFFKGNNPNYRNSYLTGYMAAALYFGPEKLDEIFVNFDYNTYITRLEEVGFENILYYWTITDMMGVCVGEYMQNGGEILLSIGGDVGTSGGSGVGVAVPFQYQNLEDDVTVFNSSQLTEIFINSIEFTYSWKVMSSNQAPGSIFYAGTLTGNKSPWEGQMGMMREFSVGEDRSKVEYCYLSAVNIAPLYANMKLLGYWDYDSASPEMAKKMREMDNRIWVGTEDLFFKMHEGYLGCSQKKQVEEFEYHFNQDMGASYVKDIFMNFHFMKNDEINMATKEQTVFLEAAAEPKDGVTEPPENAIASVGRRYDNQYIMEGYTRFGDVGYTSGKVSFDFTIDDAVLETDYNALLVIDRMYPEKNLNDSPMRVKIYNGQLSFTDGDEYMPVGLSFGANYKFHIDITFDVTTRKYSGTITQTWPETDTPKTATFKDFDFNVTSREDDYIDALMPIDTNGYSGFWVENVTISGETVPLSSTKTTVETTVKVDWSGVPVSVRPESLEVYLVFNGWRSCRTVDLTAASGWTGEFDNLRRVIDIKVIDWSVAVEQQVGNYYPKIVKNGRYDYTIKWVDTKYYYNNDFENWNKGDFVSEKTPIYDPEGNILLDQYRSDRNEIVQGTENNGNHYLQFKGIKNLQAIMSINDENFSSGVYAVSMKLRPGSADVASTGSLRFSYRYDLDGKSVKDDFIKISEGALTVGGYKLGTLSADKWTEVTVVLDFNTQRGEVFFGDNTSKMIFYLQEPDSAQFIFWASTNTNIWVDDLKVYTKADLHVEVPENEANREEEIIVPSTPPAKLDPNYKWYYSADFEYWNKGKYESANTPITDAYGNVMIDQWSNTKGALTRGEDRDGNHYLLFDSDQTMQASLFVDEAYDDGTYIVKWRMKLRDADSVVNSTVFSYRYSDMQKHNFASISSSKSTVCGVSLGQLTADQWTEVMVVLDFNNLVGIVCDWEGNKLGEMALKPITNNLFNIYSTEGTRGLCVDDLQIFSGKVDIKIPSEPEFKWFYNNNFDNGTVESTIDKNGKVTKYFIDGEGNKLTNGAGMFRPAALSDGNVVLEMISDENSSTTSLKLADTPKMVTLKFKARLASDSVSLASGAVEWRIRDTDGTKPKFLTIGGNKITIGSTNKALSTQWLNVEVILDVENFKAYYKFDDAQHHTVTDLSSTDFGDLAELNWYIGANKNVSGLYIDDLLVDLGGTPNVDPASGNTPGGDTPGNDTPDLPEFSGFYNNDFTTGTVVSTGGKKYFVDGYGNELVNGSGLYQLVTLPDGNVVLEMISDTSGSTTSLSLADKPTMITLKFKARLASDTVAIANGAVEIRMRDTDGTKPKFLTIGGNKITIGGENKTLTTEWITVEVILDVENFKAYYKFGNAQYHSVTDLNSTGFGDLAELNWYIGANKNVGGLYIDDLLVDLGGTPQLEEPATPPQGGDEGEGPDAPTEGTEGQDPVIPPAGEDEAQTVDMTVSVSWNHKQNQNPPQHITVTLYKNGAAYDTVQVTADQNWTHTFSQLPKYDNMDNRIDYVVVIESVDTPEGYLSSVSGNTVYMVYTDFKGKFEVLEEEDSIPD